MGFVSGLVLGVIVGVAVVAGLRSMMTRRSKHRISKAANIKLLANLIQDDVKKLCHHNYPTWLSFPEFERVKWLNKQLDKVWPYVAQAASGVIKESVEPLLEQYRPVGITSLKFDKLFLGNVSPQIEGIRLQSQKKGQVTMDMDFKWGGDPSIILGVQTLGVANLPIQLKNLKVFATVRVIFQLAEEIPCISAVVVALLAKPKPEVKYVLKVIGGSLTSLPGLADKIEDLVDSIVVDTLQWPHRIVVPIGGLPVDLSELELKLQGCLHVTIVRARSLKNMDLVGKSDPYVILYVRVLFKYKTKVIDNDLNPEWNQVFDLNVEDTETQSLVLQVMDEDVRQDELIGIVSYPLAKLTPEEPNELTLNLLPSLDTDHVKDKKDRGTITIRLFYHVYTKDEQIAAMEAEKRTLEDRQKAKEAGIIGSTLEAVGGAGKLVTTGFTTIGSGIGKAGKMVTKTVATPFAMSSKRVRSPHYDNGVSR